jgi:outer membrane protein
MPRAKIRTLISSAASVAVFCVSLGARGADLLDVFKQAQNADAVYSAARASWVAAQEKLPQARSGLLPTLSFSGSTQYNDRDISFRGAAAASNTTDSFNSNTLALSLQQPLYRRQNRVAYEQGKTQIDVADAVLSQASQDLITRVAQAYVDVLLARDNVAFAGAQKTAIAEQLTQAKISFQVGTATITDTHEAQARYDLAVSQEIAAQSDLEVKTRTLELLIGKSTPALAPLGARLQLVSPDPMVQDKWVNEARSASPQVRTAEANLMLAQQEVTRNRGAHHPTLDAFAGWSRNNAGVGTLGGPGTGIDTKNIGLQVAIPIYQGGLITSRVREAAANEDKARQDLESARRTAELVARQNFLGVTSGIAQVKALEAALMSSQSALDSTRLGREVGVRTQVDVLNAQQQIFSARRDLAQAKYNYIMSTLKLKAAVGRLSEADIVAVNAWLDRTK